MKFPKVVFFYEIICILYEISDYLYNILYVFVFVEVFYFIIAIYSAINGNNYISIFKKNCFYIITILLILRFPFTIGLGVWFRTAVHYT